MILNAQQLRKEYDVGHGNPNLVIPSLDLQIKSGEFTVIMGASGSGKSTLLYLLGGLEALSGGQITIQGKPLPSGSTQNALFRRTTMGFVFQQNNLVPSLTLLENILVAAMLVSKRTKTARQEALALMQQLEIADLCDRYPSQVSGGEQQRCTIARALINKPDILLADEPTGSLNSASTTQVLNIFSSLHAQGQTIIMVTHEVAAACYGERILYLKDGKIIDEYSMTGGEHKQEKEMALLNWLTGKGW